MKMVMRTFAVLGIVGLIVFLVRYVGSHNMGVFNPKGIIAIAEANLLITAVCLMLLVVIPVLVLLFSFAWRYREGNKEAKYSPDWHTNITLEVIWWTIPTIIIILLSMLTWKSTHDLDPYKPIDGSLKSITIQVVALDWKWLFIYPDEHIATVNYVVFPKDTPIHFMITADAPMNAFWIPQLGTQVYAMPGMTAQLHLMANEEGDYNGISSNFSGDGFSGMKFIAHTTSQDGYETWLQSVKTSPQILDENEYEKLAKQSKNNPVTYYASTDESLYRNIIMKFMAPGMHKEHMEGMDTN